MAPTTLAAYLASQAECHALTTIRRRLAAISQMHRFNNLPFSADHVVIRTIWKGGSHHLG